LISSKTSRKTFSKSIESLHKNLRDSLTLDRVRAANGIGIDALTMTLVFLEEVEATEDGFLYIKSYPTQKRQPPMLPNSQTLWDMLHAPVKSTCDHPGAAMKDAPDPPFEVQELQRTRGLMEAIKRSLAEMEQMKDGKHDKSLRLSVNRLKKQQTARLNQASPEASQIVEEQAYLDATLRTIRTLNSIRAIFPLLIRMFHHEDRKNAELEIHVRNSQGEVTDTATLEKLEDSKKKKKSGRKRNLLIWLLGDYVYDTANANQFTFLNESFWRILECILPDERRIFKLVDMKDVSDSFWMTLMPEFVENQNARRHVPSPCSLFDSLPVPQQAQVLATAKTCDEKYLHVFHHENESAQQTRKLYQAAVDKLINNLRIVLQKRYRGSEVRVYGSCLSNLALGKTSDVDISFHLPAFARLKHLFDMGQVEAKKYERDMRTFVYQTNNLLANQSSSGFRMKECITRARVPVIKGTYLYADNPFSPDGSLE